MFQEILHTISFDLSITAVHQTSISNISSEVCVGILFLKHIRD